MSQLSTEMGSAADCPCQSGSSYQDCCARYHDGTAAPTAEALMRSRYSAYVLGKAAYLHRSWSAQTRPTKQALKKGEPLAWSGLEIVRAEAGGALDESGIVEFIAQYQAQGALQTLHEVSRFVRENGRWVYVDGDLR